VRRPQSHLDSCSAGAGPRPRVARIRDAGTGHADRPFRAMPITCSGQGDHPRRDAAGLVYFAVFCAFVKSPFTFLIDSPPSFTRWALWTSRSQTASAIVSSPMTECHSLGSSWLVTIVEDDAVTILEHLEEVLPLGGVQHLEAEVIEDEHVGLGEAAEQEEVRAVGPGLASSAKTVR
jgi:hypothetical protein